MFKEILELVFIGIVFIGVLGATYFITQKIAQVNKKMYFNKNMEILEMLPLMQGQYLYIVKVGEGYHLMGCSQRGNITYLKELEIEQLKLEEMKSTSFQEQFLHFMKGKKVLKDEENQ